MLEPIDNQALFAQAHHLIGTANDFLEKLDRDIDTSSPEKATTVAAIHFIIEAQSEAIRRLVEQQAQICDKLNEFIAKHPA